MDPDSVQMCLQHGARLDEHDRRLDAVDQRLDGHERTLYGRDSIGIVARLAKVEDAIAEQRRVRRWLIAVLITAGLNLLGNLLAWWTML